MTTDCELRLGDYRTALADVERVDCVICDPPYSERTHAGHNAGASLANRPERHWPRSDGGAHKMVPRSEIPYTGWTPADVDAFVAHWAPRCSGWFACMSDSGLCSTWQGALERHGLTSFQPVPCVIPGMTVRLSGDGPSSWAVYLNVARPKRLKKWGTLPGAYQSGIGERAHVGGKPIELMRAIVRDYSRPGDLICDPCAGGGTTLIAARMEGRRSIGAELDPKTHAMATKRIAGVDFKPTRQEWLFT